MNYLYRIVTCIIFSFILTLPGIAVEEVILDEAAEEIILFDRAEKDEAIPEKYKKDRSEFGFLDNSEYENTLFESFKKPIDRNDGEYTLFEKIYDMEVMKTDVPAYLLKEQLTFDFDKGFVDKIQVYGAYNGTISPNWQGSNYSTNYDYNLAQIGVLGKFTDGYTQFKLLLNPYNATDHTYLQNFIADAYIVNSRIPHHKIIAGISRNQVGVEGGMSSFILPFAARSQISRNFGNTRAFGVRLLGDYSLIDYSLAMNSSDRFFNEFFPGVEFTGWVNFKPLGKTDGRYGKLVLGTGLNAGKNDYDYTVGGFYAGYTYKKFMANFEYSIADGSNGSYVDTRKASGFYTTVGYKITPKIELLARYDQFDPNRNIAHDNRREYTAGLNYYLKGQALRLILNFVYCDNDNMRDSTRIIFGTQVIL